MYGWEHIIDGFCLYLAAKKNGNLLIMHVKDILYIDIIRETVTFSYHLKSSQNRTYPLMLKIYTTPPTTPIQQCIT